MKTALVALCSAALLQAQQPQQPASFEPPFQLVVLRGDNAQNNLKKGRATRQVVEVRDRNRKPVGGVLLSFTLPKTGASGTFVDGSQLTTVTTNPAGQASVTMQPNSVSGSFDIEVSGNVNGQPVNGKISQTNVAAAGVSASTIGIILAVAAGAAVGIGIGLTRNGSSSTTSSQAPGVRIGVGSGVVILPPQ